MNAPAYILAGGKSSRFGSDKARALLGTTPLICHIAAAVPSDRVRVIASRPDAYADLGLETLGDRNPGLGPMSGLQTALHHARATGAERLLMLSCDLVGVRRNWLELLLSLDDVSADVVAFRGDYWEPLCAVYHVRLASEVDARIARKELAMQRLLDAVDARAIPRPTEFAQANSPDELAHTTFRVLAFGQLATLAGMPDLSVRMPQAPVTCAELRAAIAVQYPATAAALRSCRFAVNHAYAPESLAVQPSDELALIGFVSGG